MPNSAVVLRFMSPLVLWAIAVVIVFGVSFKQLANLQGPLSSLNAAAHVTYRTSRIRLMGTCTVGGASVSPASLDGPTRYSACVRATPKREAAAPSPNHPNPTTGNFLAFAETTEDNACYRAELLDELGTMRSEVGWAAPFHAYAHAARALLAARFCFHWSPATQPRHTPAPNAVRRPSVRRAHPSGQPRRDVCSRGTCQHLFKQRVCGSLLQDQEVGLATAG